MLTISRTDPPTRTVGVADHGRLFVAADSPLHLVAVTRDVLLFPRGPVVVTTGGGRLDFLDPLSAVWCTEGGEALCRAYGGTRSRVDWIAVESLVGRVPAAAGFLRHALARGLDLLLPLPPALSLLRRLAHHGLDRELPEVPPRAWRPRHPVTSSSSGAPGEPGEPDPKAVLARRARELLGRTYGETLPVGRIAASLGCSEGHLSRTFKRRTGMTLLGYRHGLRLSAALDRLETDGDDLAALACDLGYASHSHFTTRFERTFGLTPSVYRALARACG